VRGESARLRRVRVHEGGEHWKEEIELDGSRQCTVMSVWAELPDGGESPNGEVYGADSLKYWVSSNWFGVVGCGDFAAMGAENPDECRGDWVRPSQWLSLLKELIKRLYFGIWLRQTSRTETVRAYVHLANATAAL
jgi:hypothetical protein